MAAILERIKEAWRALDYVPDCPSCDGTGEAKRMDTIVWWKGQLHRVCYQCEGRGKV